MSAPVLDNGRSVMNTTGERRGRMMVQRIIFGRRPYATNTATASWPAYIGFVLAYLLRAMTTRLQWFFLIRFALVLTAAFAVAVAGASVLVEVFLLIAGLFQ